MCWLIWKSNSWPRPWRSEYLGKMPPGPITSRGGRILLGISLSLAEVRLESLTAEAAPVARSSIPTAGFVTVPTRPFPMPVKSPLIPSLDTPGIRNRMIENSDGKSVLHSILAPWSFNINKLNRSLSIFKMTYEKLELITKEIIEEPEKPRKGIGWTKTQNFHKIPQ